MGFGTGAASLSMSGGLAGRAGVLSFTIDPVLYWSQNATFPLMQNGQTGALRFADGSYPTFIDRPQAFGASHFARLLGGESTIRIDLGSLAAGLSTANDWWGPATTWPMILGDNAPGFPHAFVGTSKPIGIGIGKLHTRIEWGQLAQSSYSSVTGPAYFVSAAEPGRLRLSVASSAYSSRSGRLVSNLAETASHIPRTREAGSAARTYLPFAGLFASGISDNFQSNIGAADNQLASVFFRWVFAHSGLEVYGEYAREDHPFDLRDLASEPDHTGGHMLGLRHVSLSRDSLHMTAFRLEWVDERLDVGGHRGGPREFLPPQPATSRSHVSRRGSRRGRHGPGGGAGMITAIDWYRPAGKFTVDASQMVQRGLGGADSVTAPASRTPDVQYTLGAHYLVQRRRVSLRTNAALVYELNRYYISDVANLNIGATLGWRW